MTAALTVEDVSAGYAGLTAVRKLSLSVDPGQVLAIVGLNGAGKSTLLNAIAGFVPGTSGRIATDEKDLTGMAPHAISLAGVCLVPDDRGLCFDLTVSEHFKLAQRATSVKRNRDQRKQILDEALAIFPGLKPLMGRVVGLLSGGEQQMLAIAKALVLRPRVLLVDEASLGLAPQIVATLFPVLRDYADEHNAAVVIVEQHYEVAFNVADHAIVLNRGAIAMEGAPSSLHADRTAFENAYFGY